MVLSNVLCAVRNCWGWPMEEQSSTKEAVDIFGLGRPVGLSGARKGLAVRKDQAVEFWQRSGAKSAIKRRFAATASAEIRANAPWMKEPKTRKRHASAC